MAIQQFVNPYADKIKEWEVQAAQGSQSAKTNIAYYSQGGPGYADAYRDFLLRESEASAKQLGLTSAQLAANPGLATSATELAKFKGISLTEAQQRLGGISQQVQAAGIQQQGGASVDPTTKVLTLPNGQRISPQDELTYNALLQQYGLSPSTTGVPTGTQAGTTGVTQYQILNLESMKQYRPDQYDRLPSGAVILKTGVQPIPGTVKEITSAQPTTGTPIGTQAGAAGITQFQILNLEAMKQYTPDQYERLPNGIVVLKPGVQPIPGTVKEVASGVSAPGGIIPPPITSAFKNSSSYKALSKDLQDLVDLAFSTFTGTPEQQQIFADALKNAQALADPYAKTQLALAFGEFQSKISFELGDLERASSFIEESRKQIQQEVAASRDFLTLQQQAEIARQDRQLGQDLLSLADQAAEKGLTFATGARSRALAEERRKEQFEDVIQSTQRETNFRISQLEAQAAQGDVRAQQQLADLKAKSAFNLENIGRSAERVLGSTGLPSGTGFTPVGGSLGEIEQQRRESIIDIASLGLPQ